MQPAGRAGERSIAPPPRGPLGGMTVHCSRELTELYVFAYGTNKVELLILKHTQIVVSG